MGTALHLRQIRRCRSCIHVNMMRSQVRNLNVGLKMSCYHFTFAFLWREKKKQTKIETNKVWDAQHNSIEQCCHYSWNWCAFFFVHFHRSLCIHALPPINIGPSRYISSLRRQFSFVVYFHSHTYFTIVFSVLDCSDFINYVR